MKPASQLSISFALRCFSIMIVQDLGELHEYKYSRIKKSPISMNILLRKNWIEIYKVDMISDFLSLWTRFYKYKNKLIIYLRDFAFKTGANVIIRKYIIVYDREYFYYSLCYDSGSGWRLFIYLFLYSRFLFPLSSY